MIRTIQISLLLIVVCIIKVVPSVEAKESEDIIIIVDENTERIDFGDRGHSLFDEKEEFTMDNIHQTDESAWKRFGSLNGASNGKVFVRLKIDVRHKNLYVIRSAWSTNTNVQTIYCGVKSNEYRKIALIETNKSVCSVLLEEGIYEIYFSYNYVKSPYEKELYIPFIIYSSKKYFIQRGLDSTICENNLWCRYIYCSL